jgi:rubrerythrin
VISNVEYSILRAVGTDADFLYDTVDSYIKDAQDCNRSDLVELWQTIKQDRQKHANMLKEALEYVDLFFLWFCCYLNASK